MRGVTGRCGVVGRWSAPLLVVALAALGIAGCAQSTAAPKPTATAVVANPALGGETIYVTVGIGMPTPAYVVALNARSGLPLWKASTAVTAGEAIISRGSLYIGAADGTVRAFDAATGAPRWSFTRKIGVSLQQGQDGYVALSGGTLYVSSDGGAVYALDPATGKQRWLYTLPTQGNHIYTTPVVAFGLVYVTSGGLTGAVYALDARTGKLRWSASQAGGFDGQPVVAGDTLYVGANDPDTFHAYNAKTGASLWSYDMGTQVHSGAVVSPDLIYVAGLDGHITALSATTHAPTWTFATAGNAPQALVPTGAAMTLDGQQLYVGSVGGDVYALNAATGKPTWTVALRSAVDSPPIVLDNTVFVATEGGDVIALDSATGAEVWRYRSGGIVIAAPLITTPSGAAG